MHELASTTVMTRNCIRLRIHFLRTHSSDSIGTVSPLSKFSVINFRNHPQKTEIQTNSHLPSKWFPRGGESLIHGIHPLSSTAENVANWEQLSVDWSRFCKCHPQTGKVWLNILRALRVGWLVSLTTLPCLLWYLFYFTSSPPPPTWVSYLIKFRKSLEFQFVIFMSEWLKS